MAHSSGQKERTKIKQSSNHLKDFPHSQREGGQARLKRDLGVPQWPAVFGKTLEKRKEIVQYHPPRGKPQWSVVIVRKVKK